MRVGSIVVCTHSFIAAAEWGLDYPKKEKLYTVREIKEESEALLLEEIQNGLQLVGPGELEEPGFDWLGFAEVLPPNEAEAVLTEFKNLELVQKW